MAELHFTSHLKRFFPELESGLVLEGDSVAALLIALDARHPGLRGYLVDDQGALRQHVNIFVGERPVADRAALTDPLAPGDRVHVLQALSGG